MKDFDPHNHVFGSDNRCQIYDAHAPEPPAFLRRAVGAGDGNTSVVDTAWYKARIAELEARCAKLQAFKDYVHQRLDAAGIEQHPNGQHSAAGCRIGDRLDIALKALTEGGEHERIYSTRR